MAEEFKAVLVFEDADGKNITYTFNRAKPDGNFDEGEPATIMDAFITNGSIFKRVPVKKKSFTVVKTNQYSFSVDKAEG